jgi:hypothetical protein
MASGEKQYYEGCQLHEHVAKEESKLAMQTTLEHERSDSYLEDGMRDPERVIEILNLLAHSSRLPAIMTGLTWRHRRSTKPLCIHCKTL